MTKLLKILYKILRGPFYSKGYLSINWQKFHGKREEKKRATNCTLEDTDALNAGLNFNYCINRKC